jgi:hypothetical protein
VSIEHRGLNQHAATFVNCIFRNNRCQVTGSAVDVLQGSAAVLKNCLFVGNLSNRGVDYIGKRQGWIYNEKHGCGALTVFMESRVRVERCTFTGNFNGVDDKGKGNTYKACLFWNNTAAGGVPQGGRYELDILDAQGVSGCAIHGALNDLQGKIDPAKNTFDGPDPEFDERFVPRAVKYADVGYRVPDGTRKFETD